MVSPAMLRSSKEEFPPEYGRPHFWNLDSSFESSTESSSNKKLNSTTSTNVNLSPDIKEEVDQIRSMILLVMEELVDTESSYLRILTQFLVLRDEIFTPNWRSDRHKFMRLFPATMDELCKLHRDSCDAMKHAYDQIPQNTRQSETQSEISIIEVSSPRSHRCKPKASTHQSHRQHRRHLGNKSISENENPSSLNNTEASQDSASPFTVLLEMVEGRRPLGSSPNFSYRNAPAWSTSPLFKLYTRYLSEFSGSIQTLSNMKTGPTSLRKHLKQLQSHPACEFNDITSYLLAPVQRLPRYRLLVQKMIQYTEKMYRLMGIKSTRKQDSKKLTPYLPSLEELKRAEDELHKMLVELDEMMDINMTDLKMECISGSVERAQKFGKKNGEINILKTVYSNNCSENGIRKTASKILPGEMCGGDHISRCRRSQSLADSEERKSRARSTGGAGLWNRLKRLRFTFSSSNNYPDEDKANKQTATISTSVSAKESGDTNEESQKSFSPSPNLPPNIISLRFVPFQETTSNRQALEGIDNNPDGDYTSKVESWRKVSSGRMYARTVPNLSTTKRAPQTEKQVQERHAASSDEVNSLNSQQTGSTNTILIKLPKGDDLAFVLKLIHAPSDQKDPFEQNLFKLSNNRRNCRSLLTPKVLQSADFSEICEPTEEKRTITQRRRKERIRYGQMQPYTRNSTSSSNSSTSRTQNVIPRPTKLLIAKSDSDSGVNTQPEDTPINFSLNRQRIHFPMTPTTNQPRWLVNRSASRIEDTRRRSMSSSYQQHFCQRRSDGYRFTNSSTTTNLEDETNPTLSSISISNSSSSSFGRDNGTQSTIPKIGDMSESSNPHETTNTSLISDNNNGKKEYRHNRESADSNSTDADEVFTNDSMKSESGKIKTRENNSFGISTFRFAAVLKTNSDICETESCTDKKKLTTFDLVPTVGLQCLNEAC
ncbi:hypothetical protein ACTXT7_009506 [Hymenolepis weldensis]